MVDFILKDIPNASEQFKSELFAFALIKVKKDNDNKAIGIGDVHAGEKESEIFHAFYEMLDKLKEKHAYK